MKLEEVNLKVNETTDIMKQNIESILERGEKIDILEEKSKQLDDQSRIFYTSSKKLRCKFIREYAKQIGCVVLLVIIIICVIYGIVKSS